jgi:dihydrofolate reductase
VIVKVSRSSWSVIGRRVPRWRTIRCTAQRALEAGVLDELVIHQIPVLFGSGRRQFEVLPSRVELEIVRVIDTPEATHLRYRVRR